MVPFAQVIGSAANIRGVDVASVGLPTSEEGSRHAVVPRGSNLEKLGPRLVLLRWGLWASSQSMRVDAG